LSVAKACAKDLDDIKAAAERDYAATSASA
jgi:hypothetical protein